MNRKKIIVADQILDQQYEGINEIFHKHPQQFPVPFKYFIHWLLNKNSAVKLVVFPVEHYSITLRNLGKCIMIWVSNKFDILSIW